LFRIGLVYLGCWIIFYLFI